MRESTKTRVHAGLAVGHFACACYHFKHGGGAKSWHFWFHTVVFTYDFLAVIEHSRREDADEHTIELFERCRLASPECSGLAELEVLEAS